MLKRIRKIETLQVDEGKQGYSKTTLILEDHTRIDWDEFEPEVGDYVRITVEPHKNVLGEEIGPQENLKELKRTHDIPIPDHVMKKDWTDRAFAWIDFGGTDGESDPRRKE